MPEQPVTEDSLREFLTNHSNWVQIDEDTFEACEESDYFPRRITLAFYYVRLELGDHMRGVWHETRKTVLIYFPQLILDDYGLRIRTNVTIIAADPKPLTHVQLPGEYRIEFELRLDDLIKKLYGDPPQGLDKYAPLPEDNPDDQG